MTIQLCKPTESATVNVFELFRSRRSIRTYSDQQITTQQLSDILFYTGGNTGEKRHQKASPSAGGIHPITLYVIAGNVEGLELAVYRYLSETHSLELFKDEDIREQVKEACFGQKMLTTAPLTVLMAVNFACINERYGDRDMRYGSMDCGHYGQSIYLTCEVHKLGTVAVGAFDDTKLAEVMQLPENEQPFYLFPIGAR